MTKHQLADMLETLLEIWSEWARSGLGTGLGYPSVSIIHQILYNTAIRGLKSRAEPDNPTAEEVDKWVAELSHQSAKLSKALVYRYVQYPMMLSSTLGRKFGISAYEFESQVAEARAFIGEKMLAKMNAVERPSNYLTHRCAVA